MRRLVYDFWEHDIPTEVTLETLKKLGIPFEIETERRIRDSSVSEDLGRSDDWAKVYVEPEILVKWLERKIDEEIGNY